MAKGKSDVQQRKSVPSVLSGDVPVAIVTYTDNGQVLTTNKAFDDLFFADVPDTDPYRRRGTQDQVIAVFNGAANGEPVSDKQRKTWRAIDFFHNWHADAGPADAWIGFKAKEPAKLSQSTRLVERQQRRAPDRHFRYWTRKTKRKTGKGKPIYQACLLDITAEQSYRRLVQDTEISFNDHIRQLMMGAPPEQLFLHYDIRPQEGEVGGDFVFSWPVQRKRRVVTVLGDAAGKRIVGGNFASHVGWVLQDLCRWPSAAFLRADNPALWMIRELNDQVFRRSLSTISSMDCMFFVTDLETKRLYFAEGQFEAFLVTPGASDPAFDIAHLGTMYDSDVVPSRPKSVGVTRNPSYDADGIDVTPEALVVAFSDGIQDWIRKSPDQPDSYDVLYEVIRGALDRCLGGGPPADHAQLVGLVGALRDGVDAAASRLRGSGAAPRQLDDELIAAFMPLQAGGWDGDPAAGD